jgi:tetratricopeptide (TPR) repeat protein
MLRRIILIILFAIPITLFAQNKQNKLQGDTDYYKSAKRFLEAGDVVLAIGYCERGLKEEPTNMDLHNLLAKAYLLNGQLDKARTELLFILKVQPHNWDARRRIVNVEYEAKHYSALIMAYQ